MEKDRIKEFRVQSHFKIEDIDILKKIITKKMEKIINYHFDEYNHNQIPTLSNNIG